MSYSHEQIKEMTALALTGRDVLEEERLAARERQHQADLLAIERQEAALSRVKSILREHGIEMSVGMVVGGTNVGTPSPEPAPFLYAGDLSAIQFIVAGGTPILNVSYYR